MTNDPFNLQRFVDAQARDYATALAEIRRGRKTSHWIWYVFPQLGGLGRSETARFYGIAGLAEGRAYLAHPVLGARLRECVQALQGLPRDLTVEAVLGGIDAIKLRSCLTLFIEAEGADADTLFSEAMTRWYGGLEDPATLQLLHQT